MKRKRRDPCDVLPRYPAHAEIMARQASRLRWCYLAKYRITRVTEVLLQTGRLTPPPLTLGNMLISNHATRVESGSRGGVASRGAQQF